ncbi:GNAT family N-acetyltransferase [Actinoplanes sp. NPDC049265]|uniref:GNAT family N-acetyltransferase n=1 Tax=Actinoplanes sp. NPDC049265 TaxID=3363902 RepID=UPI003723960B
MPEVRFVQLSPAVMTALINGDLAGAGAAAGTPMSRFLADEAWLWRVRRDDIRRDPAAAEWVARAAVDAVTGQVVGHGGFHGPPDENATVEIAYSVDPAFWRRGYATAMVTSLLARVNDDPRVRAVRASIRPDNKGSLATIAKFGFRKIGEQWDPEDGLEHVFFKRLRD